MDRPRRMMFVDGENFTIRAQELAKEHSSDTIGDMHHPDVCFWSSWIEGNLSTGGGQELIQAIDARRYYYTCMTSDRPGIDRVRDDLVERGFTPVVIQKVRGKRAKGVDITLTKDMLVHAFFDNYDFAVLIAGDGDYVPLVEEVKRFGKRVYVVFFDEQHGLNPELRRAADRFVLLQPSFK
ncbi:NYN domain-containing protein [Planctomycetota bacterium]